MHGRTSGPPTGIVASVSHQLQMIKLGQIVLDKRMNGFLIIKDVEIHTYSSDWKRVIVTFTVNIIINNIIINNIIV